MNSKAIFFRNLLLTASSALFLYALYQVYLIATEPACVVNGEHAGCSLLILFRPWLVIMETIQQGILFPFAAGAILFGLWSRQAGSIYWSLQLAVWFVGMTLWFQAGYHFDPWPVDTWAWLIVTVLCSLALVLAHRPLTHFLSRLLGAPQITTA
jgi:hypothetical protein